MKWRGKRIVFEGGDLVLYPLRHTSTDNVGLTEDLWRQHRKGLRGYIARRVQDTAAVDDILQLVFLKAHEKLHTVQSKDSIPGWLYRIAANVIADHYRGQKHDEELPEEIAAPEPERDYAGELAECLSPFIAALPEKYGVAIVLAEIDGLPQKEVALRLGISLSGAKSRIQRGREKLRELLQDCCEIETGRTGIVGYELRGNNCSCD